MSPELIAEDPVALLERAIQLLRARGQMQTEALESDPWSDGLPLVKRRGRRTVVEVGFRPGTGELSILRELTNAGASTWWFDGDRDGALANWLRRPKPIPEALWRTQMGHVDGHWTEIADLFRSRIVRTVGPGGATLPAEWIDRLMFGPAT
jgi:hypothetical protein